MNIVNLPFTNTVLLALINLLSSKTPTFAWGTGSSFMYWWGLIASTLTMAAFWGLPMLILSPVMNLYILINAVPSTSSWTAYYSYFTTY